MYKFSSLYTRFTSKQRTTTSTRNHHPQYLHTSHLASLAHPALSALLNVSCLFSLYYNYLYTTMGIDAIAPRVRLFHVRMYTKSATEFEKVFRSFTGQS
jgi:hypothetical protein